MIMKDMPYMLTNHYIALAMREVKFPTTKMDLINTVGEKKIRVGPDTYNSLQNIIKKLPQDTYSCAAEFWSNLSAS